ncbi:alkylglycerol monooxygenase-like [Oratosquilla oratoria]|uniref:alkylglycerol monooxygenase-like n=1 Tax=Oratosquilla oratoria TaxID=337810 RepID=UPI003F772748
MAENTVVLQRNCSIASHPVLTEEGDLVNSVLKNDMMVEVMWASFLFMFVEYLVLWLQGKRLPYLHHNLTSLTHMIFYMTTGLLLHGAEFSSYVWVWRNYALFKLPTSPLFSIVLTFIAIDFGFYWFHRAGHEISLFWAVHQVHHSSDEFTFTVGLRHSPIQKLYLWITYLPLAVFGIPPLHAVLHVHFNTIFQVWTHTCVVDTLGPLEYILNTPNHHRVHHATNTIYLDKNYGGIFIIWDRIFGTFQEYDPKRTTNYGNVNSPQTIELLYNQYYYILGIEGKARKMSSLKDYLMTFIKGPSWLPGAPWLGNRDPNNENNRPKQTVSCGWFLHVYLTSHLINAMLLLSYLDVSKARNTEELLVCSAMIIAILSSIGRLYDDLRYARIFELLRCVITLCLTSFLPPALPEIVRYWFFYHHIACIPFCFWRTSKMSVPL